MLHFRCFFAILPCIRLIEHVNAHINIKMKNNLIITVLFFFFIIISAFLYVSTVSVLMHTGMLLFVFSLF